MVPSSGAAALFQEPDDPISRSIVVMVSRPDEWRRWGREAGYPSGYPTAANFGDIVRVLGWASADVLEGTVCPDGRTLARRRRGFMQSDNRLTSVYHDLRTLDPRHRCTSDRHGPIWHLAEPVAHEQRHALFGCWLRPRSGRVGSRDDQSADPRPHPGAGSRDGGADLAVLGRTEAGPAPIEPGLAVAAAPGLRVHDTDRGTDRRRRGAATRSAAGRSHPPGRDPRPHRPGTCNCRAGRIVR